MDPGPSALWRRSVGDLDNPAEREPYCERDAGARRILIGYEVGGSLPFGALAPCVSEA